MSSSNPDSTLNSLSADLEGSTDTFNLFGVIDRNNVHGLNLTVPEDAKEIIKPWDEREDNSKYLDSSVDDQLIIHVPFMQNVRIRSVLLKLGRGSTTPRHLRIYANHSTIVDFAEAESANSHLNISLLEGETGVIEYPLRVAAFTSVHALSLFFSDAVGGDQSRIYYLGFRGDTRFTKKEVNSKLEVPAPNAAEAALADKVTHKAGGQQTTAR